MGGGTSRDLGEEEAGAKVPDADHVLRFVRARHVDRIHDREVVLGSAFVTRPGEGCAISVNWLEHVSPDLETALAGVRAVTRLAYRRNDRLARLNAGSCRARVAAFGPSGRRVDIVHDPAPSSDRFPADPSHALIVDLPGALDPEQDLVGDLLAACVLDAYPALP